MRYLILMIILVLAPLGLANAQQGSAFQMQSRLFKQNLPRHHDFNNHHSGFKHRKFGHHHGTRSFPKFSGPTFTFINSFPPINTVPHQNW